MKLFFLFFLFLMYFTTIAQSVSKTVSLKYSTDQNFHVLKSGDLIVAGQLSNEEKNIELRRYDSNLNQVSTIKFPVGNKKFDKKAIVYETEHHLHLFYRGYDASKFQIVSYNLTNNQVKSSPLGKMTDRGFPNFVVVESKAYILYTKILFTYEPTFILFDLNTGETKKIALEFNQRKELQLKSLEFNAEKNSIDLIWMDEIKNDASLKLIRFDLNGKKIEELSLNQPPTNFLPTVSNLTFSDGSRILYGGLYDKSDEMIVDKNQDNMFIVSYSSKGELEWSKKYNTLKLGGEEKLDIPISPIQKYKPVYYFQSPLYFNNTLFIIGEVRLPVFKFRADSGSEILDYYKSIYAFILSINSETGEINNEFSVPISNEYKFSYTKKSLFACEMNKQLTFTSIANNEFDFWVLSKDSSLEEVETTLSNDLSGVNTIRWQESLSESKIIQVIDVILTTDKVKEYKTFLRLIE